MLTLDAKVCCFTKTVGFSSIINFRFIEADQDEKANECERKLYQVEEFEHLEDVVSQNIEIASFGGFF